MIGLLWNRRSACRGISDRLGVESVIGLDRNTQIPFVREAVESGAEVRTDGWGGYSGLAKHGYIHNKTALSSSGDPAHVSMPAVHRVSSLLQRWLLETHQGAVRPDQLDRYLDEFTFRFNQRSSRSRGLLFYRLLEQAALTSPAPYRFIVGGKP